MSGVVGPDLLDVAVGLATEFAVKATVPLAAGLFASHLPGSAAARHQRLALAVGAVPLLGVATLVARGGDAAFGTDAPLWPLVGWALGALALLVHLAAGLWALRRLPTAPRPDGLESCAALSTPITAGWWRPRILVPSGFDGWPAAARSAALAHERAHVRRRDWPVHVAAWVLGAALWFHPLAHLARRRLALLAECAADDEVLAEGHEPSAFAELLLRTASPAPGAALALGPSVVGIRVRRVLGRAPRGRASAASALVAATLLAALAGATARTAPWHAPEPVADCAPSAAPTDFLPHPLDPWSPPVSPGPPPPWLAR